MLGLKIVMASAMLTLMLTGGMAFAKSMLDTDSTSSDCKSDCENNNVISNSGVETDNDTENDTASSNSGLEQMTIKAQLKNTFLPGTYDIKKFRFSVSDGSEICPSNNCEYRVENGNFYNFGSLGYTLTGKMKVTMPGEDKTKSIFQDFRFRLDKIGEEEMDGQKIQTFEGDGTGSGLTYDITNATLQLGKNPVLTLHGERTPSGN